MRGILRFTKRSRHRRFFSLILISFFIRTGHTRCLALLDPFARDHSPLRDKSILDSRSSPIHLSRLDKPTADIIRSSGPYSQPSAVQIFEGDQLGVFGTEMGIKLVRDDVVHMREAVALLTGTKRGRVFEAQVRGKAVRIEVAGSLVGSARLKRDFGDLDTELTVLITYEGFKSEDFHDPTSIFAETVQQYLREYLKEGMDEGLIFSEAKAGQYDHVPDDAAKTASKAIKWGYNAIMAGQQDVYSRMTNRTAPMTLLQAITSDSRIKIDWFVRIAVPPEKRAALGMDDRITEGSVLVNLAGRNGTNNPIPLVSAHNDFPELGATGGHIAVDGFADNKPLKTTSVYFSPEEYDMARTVSLAAPFTPVFYLNRSVLNAARTYRDQGKMFKALRVLFSRLNYNNDVDAFVHDWREAHPLEPQFGMRELVEAFRLVVEDARINEISMLLGTAKDLLRLRELGKPFVEDEALLLAALSRYQVGATTYSMGLMSNGYINLGVNSPSRHTSRGNLEALSSFNAQTVDFAQRALDRVTLQELEGFPILKDYVQYVLSLPYSYKYPEMTAEKLFVSFAIPQEFQNQYSLQLAAWKLKYPNLEFTHPSDLHMSVAFLGQLDPTQQHEAQGVLDALADKLENLPLNFENAGLRLMGRNNDLIAVRFDPLKVDPRVTAAIVAFKAAMTKIGVRPDQYFNEFVPHITLCKLPPQLHGELGQGDLTSFLSHEAVGVWTQLQVQPKFRIMYRDPVEPTDEEPVFKETSFQHP